MSLVLEASTRKQIGKSVNLLRKNGSIPAVVYGNHKSPQSLVVATQSFDKLFRQAGESTLVDLIIDKKSPIKVLIHELQRDPVSHRFAHVDFMEVNMTEKITTDVELNFIGESKAMKELGGILVKNKTSLEISCLPSDLAHEIAVDISQLATFEDQITVADITAPKGITILDKPEEVIAIIEPPRSEKELEELEEKVEEKVEDVEVEKKGKKEEEEGEAGTEDAPAAAPAPEAKK